MNRKDRINKLLGMIPWKTKLMDASPIELYKRAIGAYGNETALVNALNENRITWKNGNFLHDGKMILCDVSTIPYDTRSNDSIAYYIEGLILERQEMIEIYEEG